MGKLIIKFDRPEEHRFLMWSTVVDGPTSYRMTREQIVHRLLSAERLEAEERVERAERFGCSAGSEERESFFAFNRAGEGETSLSEDELWEQYPAAEWVYLAGPMAGYEEHNIPTFRAAAAFLLKRDVELVSPVEINHRPGMPMRPGKECLARDIGQLVVCDAIALLPGWEQSVGARAEAAVALALGLKFYRVDPDSEIFEPMEAPPSVTVTGYPKP